MSDECKCPPQEVRLDHLVEESKRIRRLLEELADNRDFRRRGKRVFPNPMGAKRG